MKNIKREIKPEIWWVITSRKLKLQHDRLPDVILSGIKLPLTARITKKQCICDFIDSKFPERHGDYTDSKRQFQLWFSSDHDCIKVEVRPVLKAVKGK